MVLMGETKYKRKDVCEKYKINYICVNDMKEAIDKAYKEGRDGDVVLLSPASASWDMYKSYEVRGDEFKTLVNKLEHK